MQFLYHSHITTFRSNCAILETTTTPQRYFNNYSHKVKISAGTSFVSGITFPSFFTAEPKTYSILLKWEEPTGGEAVAIQEYSINWVSDSGVTRDRTVYLTSVLLINLFHKSTIHLYPRRAYSNRILIQIELQTYSNRITKKKNRL